MTLSVIDSVELRDSVVDSEEEFVNSSEIVSVGGTELEKDKDRVELSLFVLVSGIE